VKENEIILKELEAWSTDCVSGDRGSKLRARGANFLEQYVAHLTDIAGVAGVVM